MYPILNGLINRWAYKTFMALRVSNLKEFSHTGTHGVRQLCTEDHEIIILN